MTLFGLNVIGVTAATFIGMVLGGIWYSPLLFGRQWMECISKTPETLGSTTGPMIGSIVASLMTAIGVSIVFSLISVDSLSLGATVGLTLGILIIFPAMLSDNLFCGWGKRLLIIQSSYRAVSVLLMSIAYFYLA